MSNNKFGFIAAILASIAFSAIQKHQCTCQNIQNEEICNRSTNCIWLNTGCIQREIQCQYLEKQKCLIYPQCYYHNGICLQFVECAQLKDSCSRFANICRSLNGKCIEAQDCNLYATQEECKLRDKQQKLCHWNQNFCEAASQCNHLSINLRSDEACRSELIQCTLNIQGYGCQESAVKCTQHLEQSQCFWNFDKSKKCIWDKINQKCIDILCELISSDNASDCSKNNCNSDGQGCVTRKDCVFYRNFSSCDVDHQGNQCIYFQNRCFTKSCQSAPAQFLLDEDCFQFGGKYCVVNEAGGCTTGSPKCSMISFLADCLFVDSCIWEDQGCRSWACEDAKQSTSHSECLQFNCIGRSLGGCQKRPQFCDGFKVKSDCELGSLDSPCVWLNEQCWPEAAYCSKISQNECSGSKYCYQTGSCQLKSIDNVPRSFNTHQQCNEWLDGYTVGVFGGCVKLKSSCEDYAEIQCFLTDSKEPCAWDDGKCTLTTCKHLKYNSNARCQKQSLIAQKCQLAQSGDRCTEFLGSLEHSDPDSTYRILIPLESDQTQTEPSVIQIVGESSRSQYGYGYYFRLFAFYPQVLDYGLSENFYFLSRLRTNAELNSNFNVFGDRALAVYFKENVFYLFANSLSDIHKFETLNAPNLLLDGVWILLYFSYSLVQQQAKVFIKFGNEAEQLITIFNVHQNPVAQLIFTFGGKDFDHDIINGYFENIVIAFGEGAYIENFSDVITKMGAQLEVPQIVEKKVLNIINKVQTESPSLSEGTFKIEIERQHQFFDSYSFGGWYFLDPNPYPNSNPNPSPPWYTFFRLRQKIDYSINVKFGESTFYLVVFWGPSNKDIYFCTYSYQNIMLTLGNPNEYLIVGEAIISQWLYISAGYSKIESKVIIDQIGSSYHRFDEMNNIHHLYSQYYYLILGNEENFIVQGKRAYLNFVIGDSKMDPRFTFDSLGFFSHPLIPFQVYPQSEITEEAPRNLDMQIERQDCFPPSWICQDSRQFCEIKCHLRYCEQNQLSVDEACALTQPSLKCRTNGETCVKRSTCEAVQEQQGCTLSRLDQLCVWQNGKCFLRTCELADKSFKTLAECETFLPNHNCIPLRDGGCARRRTCQQIETQDACFQDLEGNICSWIEGQCIDYGSSCLSVCGDGILDPKSEQCDDANHFPYDGCHECEIQCAEECLNCDGLSCFACKENQGWYLKGDQCYTECGDDVLAGLEECDDGNLINQDGCNSSCKQDCFAICLYCEKGVCKLCPIGYIEYYNTCQTLCADGIKAGEEACDDGNLAQFDGCDNCLIQNGFYCYEVEMVLSHCNPISDYQMVLSQIENLQISSEQHILISFSQNATTIHSQNLIITFFHISNPETGFYSIGDQLVLIVRLKQFVPYYRVSISIPLDRLIIGSSNTQATISDTIQITPDWFIQDELRDSSKRVNFFNTIILIILLTLGIVSYFLKCPHIFWNIMDKLQEMSYLKYINVPFPEHLDTYLSTFELFQISKFLKYIGVPSLEDINIIEYPVLESRGKLSNENAFFLGNVISLGLIYIGSLAFYQILLSCYLRVINGRVLSKLLIWLYNFSNQKMEFLKYASSVLKLFKNYLITFPFSGMLRVFYFSIYDLYKSIFLQISTQFKFSTFYLFNYIMAQVSLILSVITIRGYSLIANSHRSNQYYNELFEGFNMKSPNLRQYPTNMILKKIAQMALLILLQDAPDVQICGLICLFLANVLLVHFQDPFSSRLDFYKGILQSYSQIISLILMLLYLIPNFKLTYDQVNNIAWIIIGMQTFIVVINLIVDLGSLILNVNSNLSKNLAST